MNITLNKEQEKHIDSIRWLISDKRCCGKSYLLAYCFIEKALQNNGRTIEMFDHYNVSRNNGIFCYMIEGVFNSMNIKNIELILNRKDMTIKAVYIDR